MDAAAVATDSRALEITDLGSSSDLDWVIVVRVVWGVKVSSGEGERLEE